MERSKSNLDRLYFLLKQYEQLLENVAPERVDQEAQRFLQRLEKPAAAVKIRNVPSGFARRQEQGALLSAAVGTNQALRAEISELELLDDPALWSAAEAKMPPSDSKRMEELHRRQRLTGLSEAEAQELSRLEQQFERVILVRSHSAWLLEQRGHDIHRLTGKPRSLRRG